MSEERNSVEAIKVAFETEFAKFDGIAAEELPLNEAERFLQEVSELKILHTGKKSAIAGAMKLVGRVPAEERSSFGQFVQSCDSEISDSLGPLDKRPRHRITALTIKRETLDVP